MPSILKAERRDALRGKARRHRVHARFTAQYNAMERRERERREAQVRREAIALKYS